MKGGIEEDEVGGKEEKVEDEKVGLEKEKGVGG